MNRVLLASLLASSLFAGGCASDGLGQARFPGPGHHDVVIVYGTAAIPVLLAALSPIGSDEEDDAASDDPYIPKSNAPHQPANVTPPDPTHVTFNAAAAQASLDAVDLSACGAAGAPSGYGHARVTFANDGLPSKIVVDSPSGMNDAAVSCIGHALANASAPAFEGAPITAGTTFHIR